MRIAAGIILIIAAVINIIAALGYVVGGGAVSLGGSGTMEKMLEESAKAQGRTLNEQEKQQIAQIKAASASMSTSGGALMGFGVFLLITVVTSIVGAVSLFQSKRGKFILIAGVLAIAAEVIGILITKFGITNVIGIAGGVLAVLAARSIAARASGSGAPAVA
jgi:hypothetical protein